MKYVNPDSKHPLSHHLEDRVVEDRLEPSRKATRVAQGAARSMQPNSLALGLFAASFTALGLVALWRISRGFKLQTLKVGRLEIEELQIAKSHVERSPTMDESGGILRFELGSSDVYENGLE